MKDSRNRVAYYYMNLDVFIVFKIIKKEDASETKIHFCFTGITYYRIQ